MFHIGIAAKQQEAARKARENAVLDQQPTKNLLSRSRYLDAFCSLKTV